MLSLMMCVVKVNINKQICLDGKYAIHRQLISVVDTNYYNLTNLLKVVVITCLLLHTPSFVVISLCVA